MVDHALQSGVSVLTGVVTAVFRETILAMGWRAAPLGPARTHQGSSIGACRLDIGADTPALLAANGIYTTGAIKAVAAELDRKSVVSGKGVSVRVAHGGRRILKKKIIIYH